MSDNIMFKTSNTVEFPANLVYIDAVHGLVYILVEKVGKKYVEIRLGSRVLATIQNGAVDKVLDVIDHRALDLD